MIRKAVPDDLKAIVRLGIESLNNDPYEGLIIDKDKVKQIAIECISSASHFSWVSVIDGKVVGAGRGLINNSSDIVTPISTSDCTISL